MDHMITPDILRRAIAKAEQIVALDPRACPVLDRLLREYAAACRMAAERCDKVAA